MKIRNILIGMLLLASVGCSNFLDEFSQTNIRASKISDYDELLLGSVYMPSLQPNEPTYYVYPRPATSCSFFNMMDDDINGVETDNLVNVGYYATEWPSFSRGMFGYMTWQKDLTNTMTGTWADDATWDDLYQRIAILNTTLEEIDLLDNISTDQEIADYHRVKGECHFLRAQFYLILANLYGKPYNPATASTDLGVPLKITSGVEHDNDKETQFDRTPLDQIYAQIVSDLQNAVEQLTISSKGVLYRASKEAAVLLLSRVYLYMQNWEAVKDVLEPNMDDYLLTSLVTMDSIGSGNPFITEDNAEVIFSQGSLFSQIIMTGYAPDYCVSEDLYSLYDTENDYRTLFFERNTSTDSIALVGKYSTGPHRSRVSDVLMLRNAEAYLNMAEACAMMGGQEGLANQYLNALRRTRIQNYTDQTYAGEQLVNEIRNERRKELCFEGHRWFDLRRYTVSESYPYTKRIFRRYCTYETTTPYAKNAVYDYVLEENDAAYTLDIPKNVKEFDTTPMPGNERPERVPLETVENEN